MIASTVQAVVQTVVARNQAIAKTPHLLHLIMHMRMVVEMSITISTMPVIRRRRLRGMVVRVQFVWGRGSSGSLDKLAIPEIVMKVICGST